MFRAPQRHGATQTHFPPRPRKSAWHCDITNVIRHTVCPHTRSNHITRYRQSSRSPATRRVFTELAESFLPKIYKTCAFCPFKFQVLQATLLSVRSIRKNAKTNWSTFHTRHPQKRGSKPPKTRASSETFAKTQKQPPKTSVSCETLAKTQKQTSQNERFVRDKSNKGNLPKRAFPTRHSQQQKSVITASQCHSAHFRHSTQTISAEGCPSTLGNAVSPRFRASDMHDLRRGLTFVMVRRACPPS